jgi:hypothetical protein
MKPILWTFIPMIDKTSQFFAILTAVGEAKHANAIAMGLDWMFSEMGLGDANGTDPIPDRLQTELINEWRRAPLNQIRVDPANPNTVITEQIIPPEVGGEWIREIGLYDVDGDLVAVANCAPSYKPLLDQGTGKTQVVRMNFIVSSSANIVLKIDPAVVLATREYVDLAISEALAKLDHKQSARVAATAAIALSTLQTIDDVAVVIGDRVLVTAQEEAENNGLYVVSVEGWTRAADADNSLEVTPGLFIHVEQGTVNGDSLWQLVTDAPITLGTTGLQFELIAGGNGAGVGTFRSVTVDALGRVIAGTNPTTLDGYGITDALSKDENLADLADVAEARNNLGLGTAAVANAQTQLDDATLDALMKVGAFGLGGTGTILPNETNLDTVTLGGLYRVQAGGGVPQDMEFSPMLVIRANDTIAQILVNYMTGTIVSRGGDRANDPAPNFGGWCTGWNNTNFNPAAYEPALGFYPVQQGGGFGQGVNKIYIGWSDGGLKATVDGSDLGLFAFTSAPSFVNGINVTGDSTFWNSLVAVGNISAQGILQAAGQVYAGNGSAALHGDGNVEGIIWGGYLSNYLNANYQPNLGFTPVQQGTGIGQLQNTVKLGWDSVAVKVTVDNSDQGAMWTDVNGPEKVRNAVVSFIAGHVGSYGLFRVGGGGTTGPGTLVAGANLLFSDCEATSNHGNPGGTWMLMGGVNNSDAATGDSVTVCLRVA